MVKQIGVWLAILLALLCIAVSPFLQPPWVLSLMVIIFSLVLYLIPKTKYISISLIVIALLYGTGWLPLFVFAGTLSIVVAGEIAFRFLERTINPYIPFLAASAVSLILIWLYLRIWIDLPGGIPLIALMGILVAVMLKSALKDRDDTLMIEGLAVAMTMFLFYEINYQVDLFLLLVAVLVAFTFGFFSYRFKVADLSGLFSGALVGIILIVFTGDVRWFLIMLTFFILGSVSTRYRYDYKASLGIAQSHRGVRGYYNVFANGMVGIAAAVLYGLTGNAAFVALFLGSVTTAAADTVAGEIGMTADNPYLITTFKQVPRGTNGGITLIGEAAALGASVIVAASAYLLNVVPLPMLIAGTAAGFIGTHVDSVVGATLENRGIIGNMGTNFIATLAGGIFAMIFFIR